MINNCKYALNFSINTGCNVNCPYCIVRDEAHKGFSESEIWTQIDLLEKIVKKIDKPDSITWVGGEPGLWSYELVSRLLEIVNNTYGCDELINVCTNGLFMKKFPFLVNDKRFMFTYHITDPENYDLSKDPYVKLKNVTTAIVVTKDLQNNYELLKKYNDECYYVSYELCDFPGMESTDFYKKYAFDRTQPTVLTKHMSNSDIGTNLSCYNRALVLDTNGIRLYNCCAYLYNSSIYINYENFDSINFDITNNYYIPKTQIVNNCKNCQRFMCNYTMEN